MSKYNSIWETWTYEQMFVAVKSGKVSCWCMESPSQLRSTPWVVLVLELFSVWDLNRKGIWHLCSSQVHPRVTHFRRPDYLLVSLHAPSLGRLLAGTFYFLCEKAWKLVLACQQVLCRLRKKFFFPRKHNFRRFFGKGNGNITMRIDLSSGHLVFQSFPHSVFGVRIYLASKRQNYPSSDFGVQ